ncbi:hypothetical protein [Acrocarpospora catenulata]|uniref:hypothetical protein n=1 Tax=Acrocarpospora catenulata TaxID=2836182 RepID=UPI001BDA0D87|nr:hypothetical protein [Acrocarpospora catenulata]
MSSPYGQNYGNYGQYGQYPPPPANPGPPPPIRPRVLWIVLSWVLFVILLIAGVLGFAGGLFAGVNDAAPTTTFRGGETVKVQLDPANSPAIWAAAAQATNVECQVQGGNPDDKITLTQPSTSQSLTLGSDNWELVFQVGVPAAGEYQVACDGDGVKFGVGRELASAKLVGGAVALLVLPGVGFLVAVIVTIVVLVRRSSARKRQRMY